MIDRLDRVVPEPASSPPDLPFAERMQRVTREIAFSSDSWTPSRKKEIAELFDRLSPEWRGGADEASDDALEDVLARGGLTRSGVAIDVGSGTGVFTAQLASYFKRLLVFDLSIQMLARAPRAAPRVCADAAQLPLRNGTVSNVIISNCFLFPAEVDRVLAADGAIIWVSVFAEKTPIYLSVEEILSALPGPWRSLTADAGWGSWAVFRRAV